METITVKNIEINVTGIGEDDFISLTDIAKTRNSAFPSDVVKNWMRLRSTVEFLGLWEQLNNNNFNSVEFDQFRIESGSNSFVLTPTKRIKTLDELEEMKKDTKKYKRYSSVKELINDIEKD